MYTRLLKYTVLLALMCAMSVGGAHADFELVGKIPAPGGHAWMRSVTGLGSDGEHLLVATSDIGLTNVYLISPETGEILKSAHLGPCLLDCHGPHPRLISAAYDRASGLYWVGDLVGRFIAFTWVGDDAIEVETCFDPEELLVPSGLDFWTNGFWTSPTIYALDALGARLVEVSTSGEVGNSYSLPGILFPSGLASYGGHFFVTTLYGGVVHEITAEAVPVDVHALNGGFEGHCWPSLQSATFHDGLLYLGGSEDSISIYAFPGSEIVIPEGDSVAVGIPGELELNFEAVTDSGVLHVNKTDTDACPRPLGVQLFPEFYEINTSALFDFVVEVALVDSGLPPGVAPERMRVFTRRSGPCGIWRDATTQYYEQTETLRIMGRTRSEDDEFSWFARAEDNRPPADVVHLKFDYLRGHITAGQDSIPPGPRSLILAALDAAEAAYCKGKPLTSEGFLRNLKAIVRGTPEIPHTYNPAHRGTNLAGRIVSRARTLAFSLRYSNDQALMTTAVMQPPVIRRGIPGLRISAVVEVPGGLDPYSVDEACVYMEGMAKCIPGSLSVGNYDNDGDPEVRAVFYQGDVEEAFDESGPATVHITCFIGGYEIRATADVEVFVPEIQIASEPELDGGSTHLVTWEGFDCGSMYPYALSFSVDAGLTWQIVSASVDEQQYYWLVPDVDTDEGMLKVTCIDPAGELHSIYSGLLFIRATAGVGDVPVSEFRLALSPNPMSTGLTVEFASPTAQNVDLGVYSVKGELVRTLFHGRVDEGVERVYWQGDNQSGNSVSPGAYFVVFRGETRTATEKVVIQR